jgi:Na+/H+ antiporter NhaC
MVARLAPTGDLARVSSAPATAQPTAPLTFYGGVAGALAPFGVFLGGVAALAWAGAPDERGFWPVLVLALGVGVLVARDRRGYAEAMLTGMRDPLVAVMILAWLLSGVMASLLSASGVVSALADAAQAVGVRGGGYVVAALVVCAVVSTATGTSFGTILLCGPLLYPAGAGAGAAAGPLAGAILAGATFGDSLSPVSDTTIASSGTQGVDIPGTVRARLPYAIVAGVGALVVLGLAGGHDTGVASASDRAALVSIARRSWTPLGMLLAPAVVIAMLLRRRHLVEGLMAGAATAVGLALLLGLVTPAQLMRVDRASFGATGLVLDGLQRGVGVSVFTLLLMALVGPLRESGVLSRLTARRLVEPTPSAWRAEAGLVAAVSAAALLTTHSVVAILTVGDLARTRGAAAGVGGYRRANLLDLTVCTWPFVLPYFLPPILMAGTTREAAGMPALSPWAVGQWNVYAWGLMLLVPLAVATGWGRSSAPVGSTSRGEELP